LNKFLVCKYFHNNSFDCIRFSSIIKTRGIRLSTEKKHKLREDLKRVKELSNEIKAKKQAEKEAKKERRRANLKRAEENRKKNEVVQIVSQFFL
jgi:rRNA-processing protein CGR1